jgi:predicted RNase H-like nuclease
MAVAFYITGISTSEFHRESPPLAGTLTTRRALVNRVKADLTEDQWDAMICALYALRIEGKPFDGSALTPNWQPKASSWRNGE